MAKVLGRLAKAGVNAVTKGASASGRKQERAFKKARKKLGKLLAKAQAADAQRTLAVPLGPITAAVATCCP